MPLVMAETLERCFGKSVTYALTSRREGGGLPPNIEAAAKRSRNHSPKMKSAVLLWSSDNILD